MRDTGPNCRPAFTRCLHRMSHKSNFSYCARAFLWRNFLNSKALAPDAEKTALSPCECECFAAHKLRLKLMNGAFTSGAYNGRNYPHRITATKMKIYCAANSSAGWMAVRAEERKRAHEFESGWLKDLSTRNMFVLVKLLRIVNCDMKCVAFQYFDESAFSKTIECVTRIHP